jgi:hypothetical protein
METPDRSIQHVVAVGHRGDAEGIPDSTPYFPQSECELVIAVFVCARADRGL